MGSIRSSEANPETALAWQEYISLVFQEMGEGDPD
jgi:hypothetical protein